MATSWRLCFALASVFLLSTLIVQGCQFHPPGDYLRFVRVPENVPVGGSILLVQVNPQGLLSVEPMDKEEDAQYFSVSAVNGTWVRVVLARSLEDLVDSDIPQSVLKFRLACIDPLDDTISSSYLSVTVYVEDVNDHAPSFIGTPYHVTVDELTPPGLTIFRGIHAVDRDKPNTPNSDVQYSLLEDEPGHFALESSHRAALVLRTPLDFDAGDVMFNLTIVASDRGSPPNNASTTLTVMVRDNDDMSPKFTRDVYRVKIPEMATLAAGTLIHQEVLISPPIYAQDQDEALNASVRYDIVAGNTLELFWLDPNNGSLFLRRALDREALGGERFSLSLRASQVDNPSRQGTARLEVIVLDINDNAPRFEVEVYNISIVENLPNGFSVLQVAARDPDKGENGEFTYELDDPQRAFTIDARTGWLTVRDQGLLDRERQTSLRMRVRARERRNSGMAGARSGAAVRVTLLDANDNNPVFQPTNVYHFQVNADAPVGEVVGQVCATDPDLGRNGQVVYDVQRANTSDDFGRPLPLPFSIESQSGLLLVVDSPLAEDRYTLLVEAADQPANPSERRTALAVATIDVVRGRQAGERAAPGFVGAPYVFWVGGNVAVGTTVGLVRVKNIDKKHVLYDLLHSYRAGVPFAIEERSGVITVVRELSKFTRSNYEFEAVITDGHITLVTNVTIHVVNAEDSGPTRVQPETLEFKVRENHSGALVGRIPISDRRRGPHGSKFMLVNKELSDLFAISNDGSIYTKKELDREERPNYHLTIISENRGLVKGEGIYQILVTVEDENDNPPKFDHKLYEGHINEDAVVGNQVKLDNLIHAQDIDMGNNAKFNIKIRGEDSNKFRIDQESGKIFKTGKEPLDREIKSKYNLELVAIDRGNLSSTSQLVIKIEDINDNAPNFVQMEILEEGIEDIGIKSRRDVVYQLENMTRDSPAPTLTLEESVAMGTPVIRIHALDNDAGENAIVTYRITSEKQKVLNQKRSASDARHKKERSFSINPNNGEITVANRLSPETEFELNVMAVDCCGLSNNISVMVTVLDVNDHAPSFRRPWYTYDLAEGQYTGWVLGWLHASDADFGENARVSYYIDQSEGDLPFSVSESGGALTATGNIDREAIDSYEFRIWAEDAGNPKLRTSVQVEVNILDVNDNPPLFYNYNRLDDTTGTPIYYTAVDENSPPGEVILQVYANDTDYTGNGNGLLLYSIAGPPRREFHIDSKNGTVTTLTSLDYETSSIHNITIIASDLGSPSLSSTAILLVAVKDRPDSDARENPIFNERHLEVEVTENSHVPLDLTVLNVTAAFRGRSLLFTLIPGPDSSHFYVDSRNGTLYLMSAPDREIQSYYVIRVHAERSKKSRQNRPVVIYPLLENELAPSGDEVRVVVHVRDENDNPPVFEGTLEGRPVVAAIPASASYGDEIVRLQAKDADEGLNGEVRYQMLQRGDDSEPRRFDVHPITGQVRGIASFARDAGRVFGFDVSARDRRGALDGHSAIANVIVYVLDEQKQVVLVVGARPLDAERSAHNITRALSRLTGLDVRVRKLEPHIDPDSSEDTQATDLYLYAVDPQVNKIVDMGKLEKVLGLHSAALRRDLDLFQAMEVRELAVTTRAPRPALLAVEAGAVALGCFVFLGALAAAICFGCVRRKKRMKKRHGCYPSSHVGFTMSLRPPYLVELEDGTTDSYVDVHSQTSSRYPRGKPEVSALQLSRVPSTVARLQRPLASVTSISRHDSGVALHTPHNCSCSSGHDTSSSYGSYEDSLKSLHQPRGMTRHHSSAAEVPSRKPQRRRQREPNNTPPPPPHHLSAGDKPRLARRNSERIVICPLDHHRT